jgi:hypothetical protein
MRSLLWVFLLTANVCFAQNSMPSLTAEQWRQDLKYFADEITTKHRDPYHFTSEAEFDRGCG